MTNQDIVEGLKRSDLRIFDYLYHHYRSRVIRLVMAKGGTKDDGEDVFHEVLLKLPKSILTYNEAGSFDNWFMTIAYYTWIGILRSRKNHTSTNELFYIKDDSEESLERVLVKERKYDRVYVALKKLGQSCQDVLRGFYYDDHSSKELAEIHGTNDGAMRGRLSYCRDKLREMLQTMPE
jgi:RNA polymerase sigma factor (sigma-70 family)